MIPDRGITDNFNGKRKIAWKGKSMKAVIVGCGNIAMVHAECLEQISGCEIVGFADVIIEKAEKMAARFGGNAYASLEEALACERPDVLHICTPHYLHVPMAVYGLEQGVHVFMEKPPAISKRQWTELKNAANNSEKKLGFCFQNRYNGSLKFVKELIGSGEAGKVLGARGLVTWNRNDKYYTESAWRGKLETEGGGALINQSIHTMDLLGEFLGKPVKIEATTANHHLKGLIEVEDTMEAYISYENANACFYVTTAYCDDAPPLIEVVCENVKVRIEEPEVTIFYGDGRIERKRFDHRKVLGKNYWGSGHLACIEDFYTCLREDIRFAQDMDGVEATVKLMLAAYDSAEKGGEQWIWKEAF